MRPDLLEFVLEEFAERASSREEADRDGNLAGQVRDTERSLGAEWLRSRGENWTDHGDRLNRLYEDKAAAQKAKAKYAKTERGKETRRAAHAAYRLTPKRKAQDEKWNAKRREARAAKTKERKAA